MSQIPDLTDTEMWIIQSAVNERYRSEVPLHLADAEVQLDENNRDLTSCPAVFWDRGETSFVVLKVGENRFRCQFFGRDLEMYAPGKSEYDELAECVVTLLQAQADHERQIQQSPASARRQ